MQKISDKANVKRISFSFADNFEDRTSCEFLAMNSALEHDERREKWYRARGDALDVFTQRVVDTMAYNYNSSPAVVSAAASSIFLRSGQPNLDLYKKESVLAKYVLMLQEVARRAKTAELRITITELLTKTALTLKKYYKDNL